MPPMFLSLFQITDRNIYNVLKCTNKILKILNRGLYVIYGPQLYQRIGEFRNMDFKNIESLENTIDLMLSDDYVDRLKAEYIQTKIRYKKLKEYNTSVARDYMLGREVDDKVRRTHELYVDQEKVMRNYLDVLELRLAIATAE
jgi:hypothetical protein